MSELYFAADWIIKQLRPADLLAHVNDIALRLDCRAWLGGTEGVTDNGYYYMSWAICVPSEDRLTDLVNELSPYFKLFNFRSSTKEHFSRIEMYHRAPSPGENLETYLEERGQYNEALMSGRPMWGTANWVMHKITRNELEYIVSLTSQNSYLMLYLDPEMYSTPNKNPLYAMRFFLKVEPVNSVHDFITELSPYMRIEPWIWLYEPIEFGPLLRSKEDFGFNDAKPLNKDTMDDFLKTLESYI